MPNVSFLTTLLKLYFRELPEPLFTSHLYPSFMEAASAPVSEDTRLHYFAGALCALPKQNFETVLVSAICLFLNRTSVALLQYFFDHLHLVIEHGDHNLMATSSLATCLGPSLLTPAEVYELKPEIILSHLCKPFRWTRPSQRAILSARIS